MTRHSDFFWYINTMITFLKQWHLPILYFLFEALVLAHLSFGSNDYGYLYGMGWRILEGQDIYTDFLYARPPLSPYLTAFWLWVLPEEYQYYFTRIINYGYIAIYSTIMLILISRFMGNFYKTANKGLLLSIILVLNTSYISHFWHTIDGVLMASIALLFLLQKKSPTNLQIATAAFFTILSMATKQSFYPLPFALAIASFLFYNKSVALKYMFWVITTLAVLFLIAFFVFHEQLLAYIDFKQYESQLQPFLDAAVVSYYKGFRIIFPLTALAVYLINYKVFRKYIDTKRYYKTFTHFSVYFSVYFFIIYGLLMLEYIQAKIISDINFMLFNVPLLGGMPVLFFWIVTELILNKRKEKRDLYLLLVFISVGWMSSLSWGFKTPALYSGGIATGFLYIYWCYTKKFMNTKLLLSFFLVFVLAIFIRVYNQFDIKPLALGDYSPKLKGIYTRVPADITELTYVLSEVNKCKKENKTYTVLSSSPYIHWIYNDRPTLSLDWVSNVEMLNKSERLKKEIEDTECVVVDRYYPFWKNERYGFDTEKMLNMKVDDFFIDLNKI